MTVSLPGDLGVGDLVDVRKPGGQVVDRVGLRISLLTEMKSGTRLTLDDGTQWDARTRKPWRSGLVSAPTIWRHGSETW